MGMELVYAEVMLGRNMRINAALDGALSGHGAGGHGGAGQQQGGAPGMQQQQKPIQNGSSDEEGGFRGGGPGMDSGELNTIIQAHLGRLFSYMRDRNDWLDQRMMEADKRFERIDRNAA